MGGDGVVIGADGGGWGFKVLRLPQNLHVQVHQVLCLPRSLHFELHKVLLARTLHLEAHKVLRLPRNLHFKIHMPQPCQGASPQERFQRQHPGSKAQLSREMSKITTISKVLRLPRNLHRSNTAPIPCACHEKPTLDHHSTRFPLCLPRKVTTVSENAHGTTTRAQSRQAPTAAHQILRACAVEVQDFERHECTAHSNELATHELATPRLDTGPELLPEEPLSVTTLQEQTETTKKSQKLSLAMAVG